MMRAKILILMVLAMMVMACSANPQVVLEKFVPVTPDQSCKVIAGGDLAQFDGFIDTGLTNNYFLAFEVANYLISTEQSGGTTDFPNEYGDASKFQMERAYIEYDFHPGSNLNGAVWTNRRISIKSAVIDPGGSRQAASIYALTEEQWQDFRTHTEGFDWVSYPLVISVQIEGTTLGGQLMRTNTLQFNLIPVFVEMVQSGAVYITPAGGFPAPTGTNTLSMEEYNTINGACLFQEPLINGCFIGQNGSLINCHAAMDAGDIIETVFDARYPDADGGSWTCCPLKVPEKPKEEETGA